MARGSNKSRGFSKRKNFGRQFDKQWKSFKNKNHKRKYSNVQDDTKEEKLESKKSKLDDVIQSSSEESENELVFNQFVSTFTKNNKSLQPSVQSSSESESDDESNDDQSIQNESDSSENSDETIEHEGEIIGNNLKQKPEVSSNKDKLHTVIESNDNENIIADKELDEDITKEDSTTSKDPFIQHFHFELEEQFINCIKNSESCINLQLNWPKLGNVICTIPQAVEKIEIKKILDDKIYAKPGTPPEILKYDKNFNFEDIHVKSQITTNIQPANENILEETLERPLSQLQTELFSIINNYQDCYYPERNFENSEEIRFIYCLHAVNHILKTRTKILHHNAKLANKTDVPDEYRDQGLVRPKVLIVVPFRDAALRIVKILISILIGQEDKGHVINKTRFMDDFSGGELSFPKRNPKPDDYQKLFSGNTDDTFRIGLSITKKSLKLYTEFYSSDIIIASPLGLRVIVGAPGEPERDYDFLASIEVLILDQTEQFLMQNWDHFLHVMNHLHMQPKDSHGTDFSRVRMWSINGWAKYYRQTLIFSAFPSPEINAFFNKKCTNYSGKVKIVNPVVKGTICKVFVQIPHVFNKFNVENVSQSIDARFEFFKNKILPQYKDQLMKHTLIYIPSYFDFVRVRNFFKQEELSLVQICEYSKEDKIARARDYFYHAESHFLLYSERFHHFRRIRLKGIRHIIFYQPPSVPHFYSELCNFMMDCNQNPKSGSLSNMTVTVLYCKYDLIYLNSIIGTDRSARMFNSDRNTHMFMTGE